MFNMENVGQRISEFRKEKNMTQMELADRMNISFQAVSNWERGISMPDISKLPELAEMFGVTIGELLGEHSELIEKAASEELDEYLESNSVSAVSYTHLNDEYRNNDQESPQTKGYDAGAACRISQCVRVGCFAMGIG